MTIMTRVRNAAREAYHRVWYRNILKCRVALPRSQSIFTVYDLFPVNGVQVVRNEQPLLREAVQAKPQDARRVNFLGAPFVERDGLDESMYFAWLKQIRGEYPASTRFVYLLHPRQSDQFGARLRKALNIEVERFALPYELELMRMERVPGVVASWFCTALDNLAVANPGGMRLVSYRLPAFESMDLKPQQKPIFDAAREFYRRHDEGSAVEVREIPKATAWLEEVAQQEPIEENAGLLTTVRFYGGLGQEPRSTLVGFGESIGAALNRLRGSEHGLESRAGKRPMPESMDSWVSDGVLPIRLDHFGKTSQRLALTFNFSEEPVDRLAEAEGEGHGCAFLTNGQDLQAALIPELPAVGTADSRLLRSIRVMLLVIDPDGRVLVMERKRFPEGGLLGFPSIRVGGEKTLDTAFAELSGVLFGIELLRAQAEEVTWFEQAVPARVEGETVPAEYVVNFVYRLQVPSRHFVQFSSSPELKSPAWWEPSVFRACPLAASAALKVLDLEQSKASPEMA